MKTFKLFVLNVRLFYYIKIKKEENRKVYKFFILSLALCISMAACATAEVKFTRLGQMTLKRNMNII